MFCATEGYFDKQDRANRRARIIAHQIHWANVEKKDYRPPEDFWPIFGDEEDRGNGGGAFSETGPEMIAEILKAHNIKPVPISSIPVTTTD